MRKDKKEATRLRRGGLSYSEISKKLGVSKSTLSDWLKNNHESKKVKDLLIKKSNLRSSERIKKMNTARLKRLEKYYESAKIQATRDFKKLKNNKIFIAGLMAYWGEGDKASEHHLRITNTDPGIIYIFYRFLTDICLVPHNKPRAWLLLYPDLDEANCKSFWIQAANLKDVSFTKSIKIEGRHPTKKSKYGVCNLGITNKYLKQKILTWIKLLPTILN